MTTLRAPPASNPPRQQRSRKSLERIVAAGEAVLRREGLDNFVMQAVAAQADVSIGGIYARFRDKEALLLAIHGELLTRLEDHVVERLGSAAPARLSDVVGTLIAALREELAQNSTLLQDFGRSESPSARPIGRPPHHARRPARPGWTAPRWRRSPL